MVPAPLLYSPTEGSHCSAFTHSTAGGADRAAAVGAELEAWCLLSCVGRLTSSFLFLCGVAFGVIGATLLGRA